MKWKKCLIKWQLRIATAVAIFALAGMPYLVGVQIQEQLEAINIHVPFLIIIIVGILGMAIVGYYYEKLGLFAIYQGIVLEMNTEWQEQKKNRKNTKNNMEEQNESR